MRSRTRVTASLVVVLTLAACTHAESFIEPVATEEPSTATVPDTVGSTLHDAKIALKTLDLAVKVNKQERAGDDPGTVVRQDPPAGTELAPGGVVTLTIAVPPVAVGRASSLVIDPGTTTVVLTWEPPRFGSPVAGYEVWRDGKRIGRRTANHRMFTDAGLASGSRHRYVIVTLGRNGTSRRTRQRSVALDVPAPPPPPAPAPAPAPPPPPFPSPSVP